MSKKQSYSEKRWRESLPLNAFKDNITDKKELEKRKEVIEEWLGNNKNDQKN